MKNQKLCENCGKEKDIHEFMTGFYDFETGENIPDESSECKNCRDQKWERYKIQTQKDLQ